VAKLQADGASLVYSSFLGGHGQDSGTGIVADSSGAAYVTGTTWSSDFPIVPGSFQTKNAGVPDAFVTKVNQSGSALVYSSYLGGTGYDSAQGISVDANGNVYVTGGTTSGDFPLLHPFQATPGGVFVTEFIPSGSGLVYSSYLGENTFSEGGSAITLDNSGSAYLTGLPSVNFPTTPGAFQTTLGGNRDAFIAKILPGTPVASVKPTSLTFGVQLIGTNSPSHSVALFNTGNAPMTVTNIAITGSFLLTTNLCKSGVKSGTHCDLYVSFGPAIQGVQTGTLQITDNAVNSPQSVPLTGTGTVVSLAPTSLSFAPQHVGTKSQPKNVALTNHGSTTLSITAITMTGKNAGDFAQTNSCRTSVIAGASCTIKVTFAPKAKGIRSATLNVNDNGGGSPQKVKLSGSGT